MTNIFRKIPAWAVPFLFLAAGVAADGPDMTVSQTVSPARFNQDNAELVELAGGDWLIFWDDDRAGSRKIFRQRLDSLGSPVGDNQEVAGSSIGSNLVEPDVATDTLGRVILAYRDKTDGRLFVNRFGADGLLQWGPTLVNDTSLSSFAGPFDLTVFPDGQIVLVWEDYSALGSAIMTRVYSPSGASAGDPQVVNSDGGSANRWAPQVDHAPGSGFVVVWEDYRHGVADIYARQFTGAGLPVGTDFALVPSPHNTASQFAPRISYSIKDRYVIGWTDLRDSQEIYLQRYDQTFGLVGSNTLVSSGHPAVLNNDLSLANYPDGRTDVVWSASGADNTIQHFILDSGLVPSGLPEIVNSSSTGQRWDPESAIDAQDRLAVVWTEVGESDPDILLALFESDGDPRPGADLLVNDDSLGAHSTAPVIVSSSNWWNLVAFVDQRTDAGDIFVRGMSVAGVFNSDEVRINQDIGSALQTEPALAVSIGQALVVWNDGRTLGGFSGQRIFGRFGSLLGDFDSPEFLISDTLALAVKASPRAALRLNNLGLIVWLDRRAGAPQVYGRWLSTTGELAGAELLFSQPGTDLAIRDLFVGTDGTDFYIVWLDAGQSTPTVRIRVFDEFQDGVGSFDISPTGTSATVDELAVDVAGDGDLILFWTGDDGGERKAFLSQVSSTGSVQDAITIVDQAGASPKEPAVAISDSDRISLTWTDRRSGTRLCYHQILDFDLGSIQTAQPVSIDFPEYMQNPATDISRGHAWYVWSDPRSNGLNVYANQTTFDPTGYDDEPGTLPQGFALAQNYPNPFNPSTEIEYRLAQTGRVKLEVINVLGQSVATLVDRIQSAGDQRAEWTGIDSEGEPVATGVYLYRLTAGEFTASRKMLLLK